MGKLITCAGCGGLMEMGEAGTRWEGPRPVGVTAAGSQVCAGCRVRWLRRLDLERSEGGGRRLLYVHSVIYADLPDYEVGGEELAKLAHLVGPCGIWSRTIGWGIYAQLSASVEWFELTGYLGMRWAGRQPATVLEMAQDVDFCRGKLLRPRVRPDYVWPRKRATTVEDGLLAFHKGQAWAKDFPHLNQEA